MRHGRLLWLAGAIAAAMTAVLSGCGGPMLMIPGGALAGEVVTTPVTDWSFVEATFVDLETRPEDPYSVELNYIVRGDELFIDPAEGKTWLDHLRANPLARVRFGRKVYPVRAVLVGQPGELEGFDADRYIYRLESR